MGLEPKPGSFPGSSCPIGASLNIIWTKSDRKCEKYGFKAPKTYQTYHVTLWMGLEPKPGLFPGPSCPIGASLNIIWIKSIRKCEKHGFKAQETGQTYCPAVQMGLGPKLGSFPGPSCLIGTSLDIIWIKSIRKCEKNTNLKHKKQIKLTALHSELVWNLNQGHLQALAAS
jgi:hypothetical protein